MSKQQTLYFPKPTGPHAVGSTSYHVIDITRSNSFEQDASCPHRELMVEVWYPAHATLEKNVTHYAPDAIGHWKEKLRAADRVDEAALSTLDMIFVHEVKNAPLNKQQGPFPLLIFSPGFAQMRTMNTALCEQVASYGYIVVSIDYTYFSEYVRFPDGRNIVGTLGQVDSVEKEQQLMEIFLQDITFVINEMKLLNKRKDSQFYTTIDIENIGIFGHSVGGSIALFGTHTIADIKAGLNVDGGIFGNKQMLTGFNKPFMHVNAEESEEWAHMIANLSCEELSAYGFPSDAFRRVILEKNKFMRHELHAQHKNNVYRVVVRGAGHMSFSDAIFLKEIAALRPLLYLQFGIGTSAGSMIVASTVAYIVAFFDVYLKRQKIDTLEKMLNAR